MAVGEGVALGSAIGSVVPGVGTVIGGIAGGVIGAGIDIFNWITGSNDQRAQQNLQADTALAENRARLAELRTRESAYQDFLNKIPVAGQQLNGTTGDTAFDQQYRALVENYGNVNVMAGVTGRVAAGSSMAAVGQQAQDVMSGFVQAEKQRAEQQLEIYRAGITSTNEANAAIDQSQHSGGLFGHGGFLGLGIGV